MPSPCDPICLGGGCPDVVNVNTIGAMGDGHSDDYQALLDVAAYATAHPGVTLVYPAGIYRVDRHVIKGPGANANGVSPVVFSGIQGVRLVGCGAVIDLKGDFHRSADYTSGGFSFSYTEAVVPFLFKDSADFSVEGFEVNGNVQLTTRDPGVVEGYSYGVVTSNCHDYTLRDLYIHHVGTDGILLGDAYTADQNATVQDVTCERNARQGMSIIQVRGATVTDSQFLDTGRTGGSYGSHSPSAGVDIEPNYSPPSVDVKTGGIIFDNCEFKGNLGSQFVAGYSSSTDDVVLKNSQIVAGSDSLAFAVILGVGQGEIVDSFIDTGPGAVYLGYNAPATTETILQGCTILTSGYGVVSTGAAPVTILDSTFAGKHASPFAGYMPYIQNTHCLFAQNEIFVPKEAYNGSGTYHVFSLLQGVAISFENHFSTDLVPTGQEHFATSYNAAHVANDHYHSGTGFRPSYNSIFDTSMPYSQ